MTASNDPFDMLFRAKWNVPEAAQALGLPANEHSWILVMDRFREYCRKHPKTHTKFETTVQLAFTDP